MRSEWVEWKGGECPFKSGDIFDIRHRNGEEFYELSIWSAYCLDWTHLLGEEEEGDIVAFRAVNCEVPKLTSGLTLPPQAIWSAREDEPHKLNESEQVIGWNKCLAELQRLNPQLGILVKGGSWLGGMG